MDDTKEFEPAPDATRIKSALHSLRSKAATGTAASPPREDPSLEDARFALALRGWVDPRDVLPAIQTRDTGVLDRLAGDASVRGTSSGPLWMLKDDARRRVLRSRSPEAVAQGLATLSAPLDEVSAALAMLYLGPVPPLDTLNAATLRQLATASSWARDHAPNRVEPEDAQRCAARSTRRERYDRMLRGGVFGRDRELAGLQAFLQQPLQPGEPQIRAAGVWGAGGLGKSTLVALLASRLDFGAGAVVVHLDFDRTDLDPTRPTTLTVELLTQVGLARPALEPALAERRDSISRQLGDDLVIGNLSRQGIAEEVASSYAKSTLYDALTGLRDEQAPLLLILDTCEQVQAAGEAYWVALWSWLRDLAETSGVPQVRALLCGRTNPGNLPLGFDLDVSLDLAELEMDDRIALLAHRGVSSKAARIAASVFGGNPLVLHLVASVFPKAGEAGFEEIAAKAGRGEMPRELVQGILYDRFLKHIDDPDARAYAHPGMVLPELTVDLIRHVLAPVRGETIDGERAQAIFNELVKASWMVQLSADHTRLVQRRDVRRLMLQLMRSDATQRDAIAKLRAAAIDYHLRREGADDHVFALYHRLMQTASRDDLAGFDGTELASAIGRLRPYMEDFPEHVQAYLQSLSGRELAPERALEELSDIAWTKYLGDDQTPGFGERAVRTVDPMIPLSLWLRRRTGPPDVPPVFVLDAMCETGEWDALGSPDVLLQGTPSTQQTVARTRLGVLLPLLREPSPPPRPHLDALRGCFERAGRDQMASLAATAAVAEAFSAVHTLPEEIFRNDLLQSETRMFLVRAFRFDEPRSFAPQLDALITVQHDWQDCARRAHVDDGGAQTAIDSLHGAPLDAVAHALQKFRHRVHVSTETWSADPDAVVALFRGPTPELVRPVRQALVEAFDDAALILKLASGVRPLFSICPRDLEPDEFTRQAMRNRLASFLALAHFADQARVLGGLLHVAVQLAATPKLTTIQRTWLQWDHALTVGRGSDWRRLPTGLH